MLKKIFITGLSLFSLFITLTCYAQSAAQSFTDLINQLHTMQARFKQATVDEKGHTLQVVQGNMALQRPGKFRWETVSPSRQLIIADGKKIWVYDADLAQVTVQNQQVATQNTPAFLLTGSIEKLLKNYQVKNLPCNNCQRFKLISKRQESLFKSVDLTFNNNKLTKMIMVDNLGQASQLTFMNVQVNTALNNQLFKFIPPKGVDVIDQIH